MKKKGFTLIELLSVIIILGIILAIAVPRIIDVINSNKMKTLESSAKLLTNNIKKDFEIKALNSNQEEQLYIIEEYEFTNESETIEYKGKLPKEGYIKVKDNGEIAYALSNGSNYVVKHYDSDEVKIKKLNKDISDIWISVNIEYVLATDSDFEWIVDSDFGYNVPSKPQKGYYKFKGTDEYVEIPHTIEGYPITSYGSMFYDSNVSGVKSTNKNVTDMERMFVGSQATSLNLSKFDTSNVTNMSYMFGGSQATSLDLSSFDTSNVTNMGDMFNGSQATSLDLSSFDTSNVTDMGFMFFYSQATSLDLSNFDTSNVKNMNAMFGGSVTTSLDLSSFDTSSVTNMGWMFAYSQATILDLSSFDTSNVTNMSCMFVGSPATSLDLSSFDTSNVTNMSYMFDSSNATSLDLSNFDTSNVTNMNYMFGYSQATSLDLSSFDTSNVTNMNWMFGYSQATSLDLSSFDTSNADMEEMFSGSLVTTGYARTEVDADRFNASSNKPIGLNFNVK